MTKLYLFDKNKRSLAGSDALMVVDGRLSFWNQICAVIDRNYRFKNFPHKQAYYFAYWDDCKGYAPKTVKAYDMSGIVNFIEINKY